MKYLYIIIFTFTGILSYSQFGINNTNPSAIFQIDAHNPIEPEYSAGLGIPILDIFPVNSPTDDQSGMLIYLKNTTDSNLEGFYYWDSYENNWEYIVDFKSIGLDISKTVVSGDKFMPNNMSGAGAQERTIPFNTITSLDPSFSISNNGLKVGKSSTYYIVLTGGVYKSASNVVNEYSTEILVNGIISSRLTSINSSPGGATDGRSAAFYIASVQDLEKNDILSIRIKRNSTSSNTVNVDSPFTLMLINLN